MSDDPIPAPDWQRLWERSEKNRHRSRRALIIAIIGLALVLGAAAGGGAFYLSQREVPKLLDNQTISLHKINQIVVNLQQAEAQRESESKNNAIAFAVILEDIAGGFATPPSPNPARDKAVQGLCDTARTFRASVGDTSPPPCPAVP